MTAQRQDQPRKGHQTAIPALFAVVLSVFPINSAFPATSERVVVNRFSGLAIEGFDPVAYFTDGRPVRGMPEFEAAQGGAVWRFRNEGNLAIFKAHPEVYGPGFGGYDPIDVARGVPVPGSPNVFLISRQRLYLFSREANRDAFAANPAQALERARTRWPEVEQSLPR